MLVFCSLEFHPSENQEFFIRKHTIGRVSPISGVETGLICYDIRPCANGIEQVEAETKTVENTKKVSSPGTMLSKMGLKPKQQYQPKVQRVIQVQQHDENSLFDNNAFQIPGVYEQKQLVDLVNVVI